jgi:hypothetical protein
MIAVLPKPLQRFGSFIFVLGLITIVLSAYRMLHGPLYSNTDGKNTFIEKAISTGAGDLIDEVVIKTLCLNRTWTENVIFECRAPQDGGFGPVAIRNVVLNCVRYAIEAGGGCASQFGEYEG